MVGQEPNVELKQDKKSSGFKYFVVFAVSVLAVMFVLSSPLFSVKEVTVTGASIIGSDKIIGESGFTKLQNIFSFSSSKARKSIEKNPFVKSVKIIKEYPDKIHIDIVERKPRAYVEFKSMGSYLLIDETGMVLDVVSYAKEELPVIVGLRFDEFIIGQVINTENPRSYEDVVLLSNLFDKYGMTGRARVEVSNENNIHLHIGDVDVIFGGIDNADEKMATVEAAIPKIPKGSKGFLDVKDNRDEAIFKYLK